MMSAAVYLKKYPNKLQDKINGAKAWIASGERRVFDNADVLLDKLETDWWSVHPLLVNKPLEKDVMWTK